jgi:hypothetical protein
VIRACYTFDVDGPSPSTITDESGNGNTGDLRNGASLGAGRTGLGLVLQPSDDQMQVQESASIDTPQFTIDAWVFANALPSNRMGIADYDGQWGFFVRDNGELSCRATRGGSFPVGEWVHVACSVDGNLARIYINGVEVSSDPNGDLNTGGSGPLSIGGNAPSGDAFDGVLDDVRIWSRALSDDEVCWTSQ